VSIFALDTGREVFGFDLDAGLDSFNANAIHAGNWPHFSLEIIP
jgi:hypothetical protein